MIDDNQSENTQNLVEKFHDVFGHAINKPNLIKDKAFVKLRTNLLAEEMEELYEELWQSLQEQRITPNLLKEMADVQYVLDGLAVSLGINLYECTMRVHESNMSKLDEDGLPIRREDGKILKGPNYKAPNMFDLIPSV